METNDMEIEIKYCGGRTRRKEEMRKPGGNDISVRALGLCSVQRRGELARKKKSRR